jgi:hypothetical protein
MDEVSYAFWRPAKECISSECKSAPSQLAKLGHHIERNIEVQAAAKGWGRDLLSGFGSPPQFDYSQLASRIFIALNSHIPTIPSTIDRQLEQRISCELQLLLP